MRNGKLTIPATAARRALLEAQGLLDDPERRATPATLQRLIEQMGFVQIDTINVVERAHHLTLLSRLHHYQPRMLAHLLERAPSRPPSLWEHWTHDASAIPTQWYPHWKHRFERYRQRVQQHAWWKARLGDDHERTIAMVRERIERDGPLLSRDFEPHPEGKPRIEDGWWGWKPAKAALEHLWRSGELVIVKRINFQKVYDLAHRALPQQHATPASEDAEHLDWACRSALERLVIATPGEIAAFWHAIDPPTARRWCAEALRSGELIEVMVQGVDGGQPRKAVALAEAERALRRAAGMAGRETASVVDGEATESAPARVLSPFDPVLRDRKRCLRLFGFDYRFEAFTPAAQRRYGYYVMPLLQGERLVGRIDLKLHRDRGELAVNGVWWERGIRPTKARKAALTAALERLAQFVGAERVINKPAGRRRP